MFKIKLKTPRVTLEQSFAVGEEIEVGNDEAYFMIADDLGELVGKKRPDKPTRLIEEEKAAVEAAKVAEAEKAE